MPKTTTASVLTVPPPLSFSLPTPLAPLLPDLGSVWRVRPLTHTNHQCLPARTEKELQHYSNLLRVLPPKSHRDGGEEEESNDAGSEKSKKKDQERSLQVVSHSKQSSLQRTSENSYLKHLCLRVRGYYYLDTNSIATVLKMLTVRGLGSVIVNMP